MVQCKATARVSGKRCNKAAIKESEYCGHHDPNRPPTPGGDPPRKEPDLSWHEGFLVGLRNHANVRLACQVAGVKRRTAYEHRAKYPEFAEAWEDAVEDGIDALEAIARQRALQSSDTLMIFLLKAKRYGTRVSVEHSGSLTMAKDPQSRAEENAVLQKHGIFGI